MAMVVLWRYALRLMSDRVRAEDLVQETLLRAWQHPESPMTVSDQRRHVRRRYALPVVFWHGDSVAFVGSW
jgi:DNA-directed RNA polymerase specialized sigma24 family protein